MTLSEAIEALKQGRSPAPGEEAAFELARLATGDHAEADDLIVLTVDGPVMLTAGDQRVMVGEVEPKRRPGRK